MSENINSSTDASSTDASSTDASSTDASSTDASSTDAKYILTLNNIVNAIDNIAIEHASHIDLQLDASTLTNQYSDVLWLTGC